MRTVLKTILIVIFALMVMKTANADESFVFNPTAYTTTVSAGSYFEFDVNISIRGNYDYPIYQDDGWQDNPVYSLPSGWSFTATPGPQYVWNNQNSIVTVTLRIDVPTTATTDTTYFFQIQLKQGYDSRVHPGPKPVNSAGWIEFNVTVTSPPYYHLTLETNPSDLIDYVNLIGEGDYLPETYADIATDGSVYVEPYTYFFAGWTTEYMDEIDDPWSTSTTVFMDMSKTVTANYQAMIMGSGGKTIGYWSNTNGQAYLELTDAQFLNTLPPFTVYINYPKAPKNYPPFNTTNLNTFKKQVRDFLLNANAVDMRYMLAAQLLATEMNVRKNFLNGEQLVWVDDGDWVYEPGEGFSINNIMSGAITAWSLGPGTESYPANRAEQTYYKNLLDAINNNRLWFIVGSSIWKVTPSLTNIAIMGRNTAQSTPFISVSPNPFITTAQINYNVTVPGDVSIKLYNSSGRLIKTVVNKTLACGSYSTTISSHNLAKGVYFLQYKMTNYEKQIKLVVQ